MPPGWWKLTRSSYSRRYRGRKSSYYVGRGILVPRVMSPVRNARTEAPRVACPRFCFVSLPVCPPRLSPICLLCTRAPLAGSRMHSSWWPSGEERFLSRAPSLHDPLLPSSQCRADFSVRRMTRRACCLPLLARVFLPLFRACMCALGHKPSAKRASTFGAANDRGA